MMREMSSAVAKRDIAKFKKAAKDFSKKATSSKEEARKALVEIGTHRKSGGLTRNYK